MAYNSVRLRGAGLETAGGSRGFPIRPQRRMLALSRGNRTAFTTASRTKLAALPPHAKDPRAVPVSNTVPLDALPT
jgi:hypothetical protein